MNKFIVKLNRFFEFFKTILSQTVGQVTKVQINLYQKIHDGLAKIAPSIIHRYDKIPTWMKHTLLIPPWIALFLITLNYFNAFDHNPVVRTVQDPNMVVVNEDLNKMISDGEVQISPFVEVLRASGRIDFNERYLSRIGANVTGRVSEILGMPGQKVRPGDVLARITSTELTQSQLVYLKARSASQLADQAFYRAKILYKEDVIALSEMQRREAESISARAEYRAANDQLRVQGMDQSSIDRLAKSGMIESINQVITTIPGEIVERKINRGQVVQPADGLFTVADLSNLWAISEVPESNSYLIGQGQKVALLIPALRNQEIEGKVAHVDSVVNPITRTVVVRMEVTNNQGQIKPGMLATMLIESEPLEKLVVPIGAVVREDNHDHVFVKIRDYEYRMVSVKLGPEGKGGLRPVVAGLVEGQKIAVTGAYHLNTERKRQLTSR